MPNDRDGFFAMPDDRDRSGYFATIIWNNDPQGLALGFYEAALAVTNASIEYEINRNTAASPILFLARHWLEVAFKSIIALGKEYGHLAEGPAIGHELTPHWRRVREYVEGRWPGVPLPGASWDDIERTVANLDEIDPKGMAFRFADDAAALPQNWLQDFVPSGIDLLKVTEHLKALRESLSGIYDGLCEEHAQEEEGLAAYHEANDL